MSQEFGDVFGDLRADRRHGDVLELAVEANEACI